MILMHSCFPLLHVHAIGATEEITVLEYEADPQEEHQEVQQ